MMRKLLLAGVAGIIVGLFSVGVSPAVKMTECDKKCEMEYHTCNLHQKELEERKKCKKDREICLKKCKVK